jgi:hypothetical protein
MLKMEEERLKMSELKNQLSLFSEKQGANGIEVSNYVSMLGDEENLIRGQPNLPTSEALIQVKK